MKIVLALGVSLVYAWARTASSWQVKLLVWLGIGLLVMLASSSVFLGSATDFAFTKKQCIAGLTVFPQAQNYF